MKGERERAESGGTEQMIVQRVDLLWKKILQIWKNRNHYVVVSVDIVIHLT